MGPQVFDIIHSLELFLTSKAFSQQPRVIHVIYNLELFIAQNHSCHPQL